MAYQQGQLILSNDYNSFVSLVNELYADTNSGNLTSGTGDFGYGQLPAVVLSAQTNTITAAEWSSLFAAMNACALHQGTSMGIVPTSVTASDVIVAIEGANGVTDVINNLRNNRLTIAPGQAQITNSGTKLAETRTSQWTQTVTHEFQVSFSNTDEARYFFNTGGEIRWSAEYTPGAPDEANEETDWRDNLTSIGTLRFGHNFTSADAGTQNSLGYYDLTTSYQTILSKSVIGTGFYSAYYYAAEEVRVEVRATDGNRDTLQFRVSFISDPAANRILEGTLNSYVDQLRSVGSVPVTEPSYSTITFFGS
jgi:hypothetical protein